MELNDPLWNQADHAFGPASALVGALGRLEAMPSWNVGTWQPTESDPWDYVVEGAFDSGNIRTSAYLLIPHLLDAARARSIADQSNALVFVAMVAFGAPVGAAPVPMAFIPEIEKSLDNMSVIARRCFEAKSLRIGNRRLAAAAYMFSLRDLVAGRVAYGLGMPSGLMLSCSKCRTQLKFSLNATWRAGAHDRYVEVQGKIADLGGRLAELARIGQGALLGHEYGRLADIDSQFNCPVCDECNRVTEMAVSDVKSRCAFAHMEGWSGRLG
jgi:hypothetical protein